MGKISSGILGGVSGQVGNVIGASWKGIDYIRIMPTSVANPQTDGQLEQRQKMTVVIAFAKPLTEFLKIGYKNLAIKMSTFNACVKEIILNAILGAYPNLTIDYPNALVAKGDLPAAMDQAATSTIAGTVAFAWADNSTEVGANTLDPTLITVLNPDKKQAVSFTSLTTRTTEAQTVTVPASWTGDLVHCYIAFAGYQSSVISNSAYAGAVSVA